jgi:hypothetical protein
MLKRRAPNGINAFSGSHWSASSTAEWMTGSLEQLPQIVLTGDRWNARARREEKQHGFLWAPPIPGPRLARRCAGLPLHSNRNLKQLYHDGFDLSTACSRSCNCHSQLTQNKINALDVDSTLGHSRTRAPNGRALWSSAIGRPSSAVKRHWSGPQNQRPSLGRRSILALTRRSAAQLTIRVDLALTWRLERLLHTSISGDDRNWETDAVDVLVPAYSDLHGSTAAAENPECFFL